MNTHVEQLALKRSSPPAIGRHVYGIAAIFLGVIGLWSGDFAAVWQPFPDGVPGRQFLAYAVAFCFLCGGLAVLTRRFARPGAMVLGFLYVMFALFWMPRVFSHPRIFGTYGGVFEQLSTAAAAMVIWACPNDSSSGIARAGRLLFGLCAVVFGFNHFFAIPETAAMVPKWLPLGGTFWAWATGMAHLAAGIAILSGILDKIGAQLLTLMILLFGALVWLPFLIAKPHDHMVWCGNAINLTIAAAAWVIADHIAALRRAGGTPVLLGTRLPADAIPRKGTHFQNT